MHMHTSTLYSCIMNHSIRTPVSWEKKDVCKVRVVYDVPENTDVEVIAQFFQTKRKCELKSIQKKKQVLEVQFPLPVFQGRKSMARLRKTMNKFLEYILEYCKYSFAIPMDIGKTWVRQDLYTEILMSLVNFLTSGFSEELTVVFCTKQLHNFDEAVQVCSKVLASWVKYCRKNSLEASALPASTVNNNNTNGNRKPLNVAAATDRTDNLSFVEHLDLTRSKFVLSEVEEKIREINKRKVVICSLNSSKEVVTFEGPTETCVVAAKDEVSSLLQPPRNLHNPSSEIFSTKEGVRVLVYTTDILNLSVDCIVNAANQNFRHEGGVAKAIADAAGRQLIQDCENYLNQKGRLKVGCAMKTSAGRLQYKFVIHAAGPCWDHYRPYTKDDLKSCEDALYSAVYESLLIADKELCRSIAFSTISSGQFGCPKDMCAVQYARAIIYFCGVTRTSVEEIRIVDFNRDTIKVIQDIFRTMFKTGVPPRSYKPNIYEEENKSGTFANADLEPDSFPRDTTRRIKTPVVDVWTSRQGQNKNDVVYPYCHQETPPGWHQKEFACVFGKDQKLFVYTCNILELKGVDVIVCGNNDQGNKGKLTEALSKKCGSDYEKEKKEQFKKKKESGDIVCVESGNLKSFRLVVHGVLTGNVHSWEESGKKKADKVFTNIFSVLRQGHYHSLALPLIGTSTGSANPHFIAERLVDMLMEFCHFNRRHTVIVHLVHRENEKTQIAKGSIETFIIQIAYENSVTNKEKHRPRPRSTSWEHLSKDRKEDSRLPHSSSQSRTSRQPSINKPSKMFCYGSHSTYNFTETDGKQTLFTKQRPTTNHRSPYEKDDTRNSNIDTHWGNQQKKYILSNKRELKRSKITALAFTEEEEIEVEEPESKHQVQPNGKSLKEDETCVICMDKPKHPKVLPCRHVFCRDCIEEHFKYKKVCPTCGTICGVIEGDQPCGEMTVTTNNNDCCAGYETFGRIEITYKFDPGKQVSNHPDPGQPYTGITRTAYLPDNNEGRTICKMLEVAFKRKLVFTIGRSRTTGKDGVITWNDIHHKTDPRPNKQFGYPDPTYLGRVTDELKAKGVTVDDIPPPSLRHRRH